MSRPYIVESGRGRLILNELPDAGSITVDVNGAGFSVILNRAQLMATAAALALAAKRLGVK